MPIPIYDPSGILPVPIDTLPPLPPDEVSDRDVIAIVDKSDLTQGENGVTKKVELLPVLGAVAEPIITEITTGVATAVATDVATEVSNAIGIPVVADNTERDAKYPNPEPNQRVQNLAEESIQIWDAVAGQWETSFLGALDVLDAVAQAEQARDDSYVAAGIAADEADRAEAARDAAFVNADVYEDVPAGLAGTTEGEQFQVEEDGYMVRYRHDPGPTAVEVARYPSAGIVQPILSVVEPMGGQESLHVFVDNTNRVVGRFIPSGEFLISDPLTGEEKVVQETLRSVTTDDGLQSVATFATSDNKSFAFFDKDYGLHLHDLDGTVQGNIGNLREDINSTQESEADRVNISISRNMFESDRMRVRNLATEYYNEIVKPDGVDPGTDYQRIPAILPLSATTALLVWQQRKLTDPPQSGDARYQRLVCCDITYTPGVGISASATRVIDQPEVESQVSLHPHVFKNGAGHIICLYNNNDDWPGETTHYKIYKRVSTDNGQTWGERELVMGPMPEDTSISTGSNGTVVQVPAGLPNAGRWLVPVYGPAGRYAAVIQSDDDGATWEMGPIYYGTLVIHEPSIALTHEGDLLMCLRTANDTYRAYFVRMPLAGPLEWQEMGFAENMVVAQCNMSMLQPAYVPNSAGSLPSIIHSGPDSIARRNLRLRLSYNCGRTWMWAWKRPDVPDGPGGPGGYTSISMLSPDLFIVAYETAASSFVPSSIGVYVVNLAEILQNGYSI